MTSQRATSTLRRAVTLGLSDRTRAVSVENLNQLLEDSITFRDMYKKDHWQVPGATFYAIDLLFDKPATEQTALVDVLAERGQTLATGRLAAEMGDDGTNDLAVSAVVRTNETQTWFVSEHVAA